MANRNEISPKWAFCICDFETTGISEDSVPIEVGCIWTDHNFCTIDVYDQLILWDDFLERKESNWVGEEMYAFKVHGIQFSECMAGKHVHGVANDIYEKTMKLRRKYDRIILISDNAKFETDHMKKIISSNEVTKWPFHYCTWDSSTLLFACGVGDPNPEHRAFRDAALLQRAMIQAMDRTRNLR